MTPRLEVQPGSTTSDSYLAVDLGITGVDRRFAPTGRFDALLRAVSAIVQLIASLDGTMAQGRTNSLYQQARFIHGGPYLQDVVAGFAGTSDPDRWPWTSFGDGDVRCDVGAGFDGWTAPVGRRRALVYVMFVSWVRYCFAVGPALRESMPISRGIAMAL